MRQRRLRSAAKNLRCRGRHQISFSWALLMPLESVIGVGFVEPARTPVRALGYPIIERGVAAPLGQQGFQRRQILIMHSAAADRSYCVADSSAAAEAEVDDEPQTRVSVSEQCLPNRQSPLLLRNQFCPVPPVKRSSSASSNTLEPSRTRLPFSPPPEVNSPIRCE